MHLPRHDAPGRHRPAYSQQEIHVTDTNLARTTSLCLAFAAIACSGAATAATRNAASISNAAGVCQSALPVFDGVIRKRPLAIQNEGTSDAFVTCPMTITSTGGSPTRAEIYASSNDSAVHTVSCTLVSGYSMGPRQAVTRTISVPADGQSTAMIWQAADFNGAPAVFPSSLVSMSCLLPPGAGLNDTYLFYPLEVGA